MGIYTCINPNCMHKTNKKNILCRTCSPPATKGQKVTERRMEWFLTTWADEGKIPLYLSWDKRIDGIIAAACNAVRPDFLYDFTTWILCVENDEHSHQSNEPRCDMVRIQDITNAFGQVPIYVVRFNPHTVRVNGVIKRITIEKQMELLLKTIQAVIAKPNFDDHIIIHYLYYPCTLCTSSRECSFQHVDRFTTILEYAAYIEANYPLRLVGTHQKPGPSASAEH